MTLMFRMGEFERVAFEHYAREHPHQWRGVHGLWALVRRATEAIAPSRLLSEPRASSASRYARMTFVLA